MADVFVSYSQSEAALAARLTDALRMAGLDVKSDRQIRLGDDLKSSLAKGISESRALVFLVPEAVGHGQKLELETAMLRNATGNLLIFPVQIPGRSTLPYDIARFRYINLKSEWDLDPVVEVVAKALRSAVAPTISTAALRASFLSTLLHTDLNRAPLAAALILDEISQTVETDIVEVVQQLDILREAAYWGRRHLGSNHPSVTILMYRLAAALLRSGEYEESEQLSRQVLATTTNPRDRLEANVNLGNVLLAMGREGEAERYYQDVLSVARFTTDPAAGIALVALGTIALRRGDRDNARAFFEEAVHRSTKLADPNTRVNALLGLCEVLLETGENPKGMQYAEYVEEALWLTRTELKGDVALEQRVAAAAAGIDQ